MNSLRDGEIFKGGGGGGDDDDHVNGSTCRHKKGKKIISVQ